METETAIHQFPERQVGVHQTYPHRTDRWTPNSKHLDYNQSSPGKKYTWIQQDVEYFY